MEMEDKKLKRFLQDEMNREADLIMKEVDSDPSLKDVVAPEEIYDNLMQQIHDYEAEQASKNSQASEEEQELIRLGKLYKKKRSRRKYYVLLLAGVVVLAYGITSIGGGKKVFTEMKRMLGDKDTHIRVSSGNEEEFDSEKATDEEDAYEQIHKKFGFYPIKLLYLPKGMEFEEMFIAYELQNARLCYADESGKKITYYIFTNNRTGSTGMDIQDKLISENEIEISGIKVTITEYLIEENNTKKWSVHFAQENAQYFILITGIEIQEVEKIVENLYFS